METLIRLVVVALAVFGLANAIAVLKAGAPIRMFFESRELSQRGVGFYPSLLKKFWTFWRILFSCPPCLSFWIGLAASQWAVSITRGVIAEPWTALFADGLIICATSWMLHLWCERTGHGLDV